MHDLASSFHIFLPLLIDPVKISKFPILIKFSGKRYYKLIQPGNVASWENRESFVYVYIVKRHIGEILNFVLIGLGKRSMYI